MRNENLLKSLFLITRFPIDLVVCDALYTSKDIVLVLEAYQIPAPPPFHSQRLCCSHRRERPIANPDQPFLSFPKVRCPRANVGIIE
jgi:hypothetical protein